MRRNGARTTLADCAGRVEPPENPAASREPIGLLIASARSRLKQAVLTRAAAHGLAVQQFWFLIALLEAPGVSQVELADRVRSDAPTTSRVISSLMRRRLVRRVPDPGDGRLSRLSLTLAGERLARDLAGTASQIRAALIAGMSEIEQEALRDGLRRVIANLDRLAPR